MTSNIKIENPFLSHLLSHQRKYLSLLLLIIITMPLLLRSAAQQPLLTGGETYYLLTAAQQGSSYNPLAVLASVIPDAGIFLLSPLLSITTLLLFFHLAKKLELSETTTFLIALFAILSPAFIFSSTTLSSTLGFLFLTLSGFSLLVQENKTKYLSIFPFIIATFFDFYSTALLIILLVSYFVFTKKIRDIFSVLILVIVSALLVTNKLLLKLPIILGPFHIQKIVPDLISDFGGVSGIGLFAFLLAFIGIIVTGKKKIFLWSLPLTVLFIVAFLLNTNTILFISILIICYAAAGLKILYEQHWMLPLLKKATIFLLILGIGFSAVAYLDRLSDYSPSATDQATLNKIKSTQKNGAILSAPENSYYIQYFTGEKTVFNLHQGEYRKEQELAQKIFMATYIEDLFPLLEDNNVSLIYLSSKMKENLPPNQGLIFLLQNERFKLLYSSENTEVWSFIK